MREYGIGLADYLLIYQAQGGKCAICGIELRLTTGTEGGWHHEAVRAELDHQHKVKDLRSSVRGLLCGGRWKGCNRRLGKVDNIEWMEKALTYLKAPPAIKVLGSTTQAPTPTKGRGSGKS